MLIELNNTFNIDGSCIQLNHQLSLTDYELNGTHPFQSPICIKGTVANKAGIVSLHAKASFTYSGNCDRCAEPFRLNYIVAMEHTLVTHLENDENDAFLLVENGVLDLDELAMTDILLALPTKMLCKQDCKGLCPVCGQNLNQSHCNCKKPVDPRLEALMQLLEE